MPGVRDVLEAVWLGGQGYVCLAVKPEGGTLRKKWVKYPDEVDALLREAKAHKGRAHLYYSPAVYRTKKGDKGEVEYVRTVWVDVDDPWALDLLRSVQPAPNIIVQTSKHRAQALFLLNQPAKAEDIETSNRALAELLGADLSGVNANKLLRLPGSLNHKSKPPWRTHTKVELSRRHDPDALLQASTNGHQGPSALSKIKPVDRNLAYGLDRRGREITEQTHDRSKEFWALLNVMHDVGLAIDEAREVACWARDRWLDRYTDAQIDSQLDKVWDQEPGRRVSTVVVRKASEVTPQKVTWLWGNRIPRAMVTILDGDPGIGKSTVSLDIAARVSSATRFADGWQPKVAHSVILLSAEDDAAVTIRPRLEAAGADLDRVFILDGLRDDEGNVSLPVIPDDLQAIGRVARQEKAALLVIDPFVAYIDPKTNTYNDHEARLAMNAIKRLAEEHRMAVVLVRHLTKGSGGAKALYRGGGSIGIIAAARSGLIVAEHPDNADLRVLAQTKLNVGRYRKSLTFHLASAEGNPQVAVIDWQAPSDLSADDLLKETDNRRKPRDLAKEFLLAALDRGPARWEDLIAPAEEEGITESTLRRARDELKKEGLIGGRKTSAGHWIWFLAGQDGVDPR